MINDEKKNLLTIGELGKIFDVSCKALKYYEKFGLIKPVLIDPNNKYRYYQKEQAFQILVIIKLQKLNFKLSEIKQILLSENLQNIELFLDQNIKKIQSEVIRLEKIKNKCEIKKKIIKKIISLEKISAEFAPEIQIKEIPERIMASIRYKGEFTIDGFLERSKQLGIWHREYQWDLIDENLVLFHDRYIGFNPKKLDYEVGMLLMPADYSKFPMIQKIEGGTYAAILYKGYYTDSINSYKTLEKWIEENQYEIKGPVIQRHFYPYFSTQKKIPQIVELQVLIQKKY